MARNVLDHTSWDARKTDDGRVSVVDVIAHVTGKSFDYSAQVYRRLLAEERVPECATLPLAPRVDSAPSTGQRTRRGGARGNAPTPVATAAQMVEILWQLPGTAEFRRNCARTCVRYLGGDPTLVPEIAANRAAQERLAETDPSHPARIFGEAVEAEPAPETARQLRLQNDQLELSVLTNARQALLDAGHALDDAQEWSFRDRVSNLLRGTGGEATQTVHAGQFLADRLPAAEARRWSSKFGRIAAGLKREADGLEPGAQLPTALKNVDGNPTRVVVYRVPEELGLLEAAYQVLQRHTPLAPARQRAARR